MRAGPGDQFMAQSKKIKASTPSHRAAMLTALRSIHLGDGGLDESNRKWLDAFLASNWVAETPGGPVLTDAGHKALQDMLAEGPET
jgi:hypothetical protein